jgi:hypothetical protein
MGWGYIKLPHKSPTYYTKPQYLVVNKAPKDYTKPLILNKAP